MAAQFSAQYEENYKSMIDFVKTSDTKERVLATQLIARYFKYFPAYEESAFDSIVDLCESVDINVRKHATMALIAICRDCKQHVSKAADILIQLYQLNEASEVNLINQSLMTLMSLDIEKFLQSFFANFSEGHEKVRERALKFLSTKIFTLPPTALTKEVEEQLLTLAKKTMQDCTRDEFIVFIGILSKLKIVKAETSPAVSAGDNNNGQQANKDPNVIRLGPKNKFKQSYQQQDNRLTKKQRQ